MTVSNLGELFLHDLKDIYDAEKRLVKALPKMAKKATSEDLQAAFEEHASVTEEHVNRLERIFEALEKPLRGKKCAGMEGLVKEGDEVAKDVEEGPARDAALIGAAQKVEHYEIAAYGTLVTYAKLLDIDEAVNLLEKTLAEEKETDEKLTSLAADINLEAEAEEYAEAEVDEE
jgi:ferritin-like metal-binding protein YciE